MRTLQPSFALANIAPEKYPRFVVGIIFETDSLYFTSHEGIPNVPGVITERVLTVRDARSQRIVPDEGRSEIGVVNFDLLDVDGIVTGLFNAKLVGGAGLRGRKVVLYHGWDGADFSVFQVFQTQVIQSVEFERGAYRIRCADVTREQRKDIFEPKVTRLTASIDAAATSITVGNAMQFQMVAHGASFSDAPSSTVGYIQIEKEIIRYTGISGSNTFTGCTRGVLNTRAVPHVVDLNTQEDRRTEVKEVIYLELPVPKLILAVLTGELYGQSANLPAHWHLGIDPSWVRTADFTDIGQDLWNPSSDGTSFVARFTSLKRTDGKKFLESQLYQLIGCYPLVYSDGTIGIRRMNRILHDAPYVQVLEESNVKSRSSLVHDMESVANDFEVQWNFDQDGKPTRFTRMIDGVSIGLHGKAERRRIRFEGLYGSRHTDATVRTRLDSMRDRYAHPPARLALSAMPHLNVLEVGDVVRVRLAHVRDFASGTSAINRSMEIQSTRIDLRTGDVDLELFGSTGIASTQPADWDGGAGGGEGDPEPPDTVPMPDGFYDSVGTELGTVVDMTEVGDVWTTDAGTFVLTGHADATNAAAIYYHLGDLTISNGTTLQLEDNVQLRVMGHLTINGVIDGVEGGHAGVADVSGYGTSANGVAGFGSTRGMDGVGVRQLGAKLTIAARTTIGLMTQVPTPNLQIIDGTPPTLQGLPTDLRGTSGGPGGKAVNTNTKTVAPFGLGGTGGAGGAGLITVTRGLSLGASGQVDLSGGDSAMPVPSFTTLDQWRVRPGAGAPGCPGGWLIVLDGQDLSLPDLSGGRFLALTGESPAPRVNTLPSPSGPHWSIDDDVEPGEGYIDPAMTDGEDLSNSAHNFVYLAVIAAPLEDQPSAVPAPSDLAATGVPNGILLTWTTADFDQFDSIEVYAATTNDRSGATKVWEGKATSYLHPVAPSTTRYFWIRSRRADLFSTWEPSSATGGVSATST